MYNIHSHYENILAFLNNIITEPTVIYLHPFGTSQSDNIEALQNGGYGPLIIAYDQEPLNFEYNRPLFEYINQNFKDDQGQSRPTVLLTTEKVSEEKNKILKHFGYADATYFFHVLAAADWYRGYLYCSNIITPTKRQIQKKYITFNRITGNARTYRSFLIAELGKRDLLKYGHVSYSEVCPEHGHYKQNLMYSVEKYGVSKEYVLQIQDQLDKITFPLSIDSNGPIPNGSQTIGPLPQLMESFLHIVTETCFWDSRTHLTEKIFKPIVARQPFVLLGCPGNLKYLRSYGFKTFDSWWDESYDEILDPVERIQAVANIVADICNSTNDELQNILGGMNHILEHNYNLFYSQKFINSVWNEMAASVKLSIAQLQPRTV